MSELDYGLFLALGLALGGNVLQALAAERRARSQARTFEEIKAYILKTAAAQWDKSLEHTCEFAKNVYRQLHPGQCRIVSEGNNCRCFLCRVDDFIAAARDEGSDE